MARRARLTKRLQHQYNSIIRRAASSWFYPHPYAGDGWSRIPSNQDRQSAWQAYLFAKEWGGRAGVDVKRLEGLVCKGGDAECAYRFCMEVRGASVKRLQQVVILNGDARTIRKFAKNVPGANVPFLEAVILIAEVMRG